MSGPVAALLDDGRLHLQHGPIDLIVAAFGERGEIRKAYRQVGNAFASVLSGLAAELPLLRTAITDAYPLFQDPIARRLAKAVYAHRRSFVTPMAAVAGGVADHMLAALCDSCRLTRAYVNNGGDIAMHLAPGTCFTVGLVQRPDLQAIQNPETAIRARIAAEDKIAGMATSGWRGRSYSLGIADAVTVLAGDAAAADVAATLIANAVNVDLPEVRRVPARLQDPDSDLGDRLVTVAVPELPDSAVQSALLQGVNSARGMLADGLIAGAVLRLQDQIECVGPVAMIATQAERPTVE